MHDLAALNIEAELMRESIPALKQERKSYDKI
jgi:hypothetical protein